MAAKQDLVYTLGKRMEKNLTKCIVRTILLKTLKKRHRSDNNCRLESVGKMSARNGNQLLGTIKINT